MKQESYCSTFVRISKYCMIQIHAMLAFCIPFIANYNQDTKREERDKDLQIEIANSRKQKQDAIKEFIEKNKHALERRKNIKIEYYQTKAKEYRKRLDHKIQQALIVYNKQMACKVNKSEQATCQILETNTTRIEDDAHMEELFDTSVQIVDDFDDLSFDFLEIQNDKNKISSTFKATSDDGLDEHLSQDGQETTQIQEIKDAPKQELSNDALLKKEDCSNLYTTLMLEPENKQNENDFKIHEVGTSEQIHSINIESEQDQIVESPRIKVKQQEVETLKQQTITYDLERLHKLRLQETEFTDEELKFLLLMHKQTEYQWENFQYPKTKDAMRYSTDQTKWKKKLVSNLNSQERKVFDEMRQELDQEGLTHVSNNQLVRCFSVTPNKQLCLQRIRKAVQTRINLRLHEVQESEFTDLLRLNIFVVNGTFDREGRPIIYVNFQNINLKNIAVEHFQRFAAYMMDKPGRLMRPCTDEQLMVADFQGFGYSNFYTQHYKSIINLVVELLSGRNNYAKVINGGWILKVFKATVYQFFPETAKKDLEILGQDYQEVLRSYIDPQFLPVKYGGQMEDQF